MKYFVSYVAALKDGGTGQGRIDITWSKISSIDDIELIEEAIRDKFSYQKVLVINYLKF